MIRLIYLIATYKEISGFLLINNTTRTISQLNILTHPGRRPILSEITEDPLFFRCILKAMKIIEFELCQLLLTVDVSGLPRVIDFSAGKRKLRFCICSDSFVYLL
jgi:hypothetical protein